MLRPVRLLALATLATTGCSLLGIPAVDRTAARRDPAYARTTAAQCNPSAGAAGVDFIGAGTLGFFALGFLAGAAVAQAADHDGQDSGVAAGLLMSGLLLGGGAGVYIYSGATGISRSRECRELRVELGLPPYKNAPDGPPLIQVRPAPPPPPGPPPPGSPAWEAPPPGPQPQEEEPLK